MYLLKTLENQSIEVRDLTFPRVQFLASQFIPSASHPIVYKFICPEDFRLKYGEPLTELGFEIRTSKIVLAFTANDCPFFIQEKL